MSAELKRLAEAATPWKTVKVVRPVEGDETGSAVIGAESDGEFYSVVTVDCDQYYFDSKPLAYFYAAARPDVILKILSERDALYEALKAVLTETEGCYVSSEKQARAALALVGV
jgi:hypothetical protein